LEFVTLFEKTNCTPSRPLWEVKSHLARSVVRWVTTCEARVLFVLFCLPAIAIAIAIVARCFFTLTHFVMFFGILLSAAGDR
jgi:hypothetical protein